MIPNDPKSRKGAVLVVSSSGDTSNQLRLFLKTIGYSNLVTAPTHGGALERMRSRPFSFVIFDARYVDMPVADFVRSGMDINEEAVLVAVSSQPRIDDVFGLLRAGARGYLAVPFTANSVDEVVQRARSGPPFSESVLQAPDRNAALAGVVLNNLYRLSVLMRQSREFDSARREVERMKCFFSESMDLALLFCEGADEMIFRERIIEDCISRASAAASRLGRTRQKLKKKRSGDNSLIVDDAAVTEDASVTEDDSAEKSSLLQGHRLY